MYLCCINWKDRIANEIEVVIYMGVLLHVLYWALRYFLTWVSRCCVNYIHLLWITFYMFRGCLISPNILCRFLLCGRLWYVGTRFWLLLVYILNLHAAILHWWWCLVIWCDTFIIQTLFYHIYRDYTNFIAIFFWIYAWK